MMRGVWLSLWLGLWCSGVAALELTLPANARLTEGQNLGLESYALPTGVYEDGKVPARNFEGFVLRQAWRIEGLGITPLQVLQPIRDDLKAKGFTTVFECAARECGGFDFRFGTDVMAAPDMIVDLDNYRFLSALQGETDTPSRALSLLVSRNQDTVYMQIIQVSVEKSAKIKVDKGEALIGSEAPQTAIGEAETPLDLDKQLEIKGHVILSDLVFETGSSDLGGGTFDSLSKLANYLAQNPERKIALVGHTDAVGGLQGNIALSKRRAASVRRRLIDAFSVPQSQLSAEGMGYLAPVASNLSEEGRNANRRVEAVLISTQ